MLRSSLVGISCASVAFAGSRQEVVSTIYDENADDSNLILSAVSGGSISFVPSMFQGWHLEILTNCGQ